MATTKRHRNAILIAAGILTVAVARLGLAD